MIIFSKSFPGGQYRFDGQQPLLLLMDGHKSHMSLDLVDLCRENNVILFCLPPHMTHALQPLDVSVFKSLKDNYSKSVHSIAFARKNFIVTKRDFSCIIKLPFERAFSIPNIKAGFAKCGIYPFNRDAMPIAIMIPSSLHDSSSSSGS